MPKPTPAQPKLDSGALNAAFEGLKTYDWGSSRAVLLPIDVTVAACLNDKTTRKEMERRLVTALNGGGSAVAREYICSKLTLIGSEGCVPAMAALLNTRELATAARNALESILDRQAIKALRGSLAKVEGLQKVGVINSLGARRDTNSIRALATLLKDHDVAIAGAAAAALGDIASTKAAKTLREFLPNAPETIHSRVTNAILTCAERLLTDGRREDAQALYQLLATAAQPKHIRDAVAHGLELTSGKK